MKTINHLSAQAPYTLSMEKLSISQHPRHRNATLITPALRLNAQIDEEALNNHTPQHIILIFDVSGSMNSTDGTESSRLQKAKEAAKELIASLPAGTFISLAVFSGIDFETKATQALILSIHDENAERPCVRLNKDENDFNQVIDSIHAGGGTYIRGAFQVTSDNILANDPDAHNHFNDTKIVLLTDGCDGCDKLRYSPEAYAKSIVTETLPVTENGDIPQIIPIGISPAYNMNLLQKLGAESGFPAMFHITTDFGQVFESLKPYLGPTTGNLKLVVEVNGEQREYALGRRLIINGEIPIPSTIIKYNEVPVAWNVVVRVFEDEKLILESRKAFDAKQSKTPAVEEVLSYAKQKLNKILTDSSRYYVHNHATIESLLELASIAERYLDVDERQPLYQEIEDFRQLLLSSIQTERCNDENARRAVRSSASLMSVSCSLDMVYQPGHSVSSALKAEIKQANLPLSSDEKSIVLDKTSYLILNHHVNLCQLDREDRVAHLNGVLSDTHSPAGMMLRLKDFLPHKHVGNAASSQAASSSSASITHNYHSVSQSLSNIPRFTGNKHDLKAMIEFCLHDVAKNMKLASIDDWVNTYSQRKMVNVFQIEKNRTLTMMPFSLFVGLKQGDDRCIALATALALLNTMHISELQHDSSLRMIQGKANNGEIRNWVVLSPSTDPRDTSKPVFLIDPMLPGRQKAFNLRSKKDLAALKKNYNRLHLDGILSSALIHHGIVPKGISNKPGQAIPDALLDFISDEDVSAFQNDKYDNLLICPIHRDIMRQPVRIEGEDPRHVFDKESILAWWENKRTNPLTGKAVDSHCRLTPAEDITNRIFCKIDARKIKKTLALSEAGTAEESAAACSSTESSQPASKTRLSAADRGASIRLAVKKLRKNRGQTSADIVEARSVSSEIQDILTCSNSEALSLLHLHSTAARQRQQRATYLGDLGVTRVRTAGGLSHHAGPLHFRPEMNLTLDSVGSSLDSNFSSSSDDEVDSKNARSKSKRRHL